MVMDVDHDPQPDELALFFTDVDLILTEGYKRGRAPKVEVFRREILPEPMCKDDPQLMALVSDEAVDVGVPRYSTEDIEGLADFLIAQF
jgi:molybdopterin-guanine dinucleotide biosynthesis protein